jgi:hypothetical protein
LKALLCQFEIVTGLHVEIKFWRPARQASKPQRHLGGSLRRYHSARRKGQAAISSSDGQPR